MSVYRAPEAPAVLPRNLQRRSNAMGAIRWFARIVILPHIVAGLGLLMALGVAAANPILGQDTDGHISEERVGRGKGGYYYQVTYVYTYDGDEFSGNRSFSLGSREQPSVEERLAPGSTVTVHHIGVGKLRQDELVRPGESTWNSVPPLFFFAAFWNGITAIIARMLWYIPWRNRHLFRWGTAVPGVVDRKYTKTGKNTSYHVDYSYTSTGGARVSDSTIVSSKELWDPVREGQEVTVLHAPNKEKPSVVYECGDYEWASPSGVQTL